MHKTPNPILIVWIILSLQHNLLVICQMVVLWFRVSCRIQFCKGCIFWRQSNLVMCSSAYSSGTMYSYIYVTFFCFRKDFKGFRTCNGIIKPLEWTKWLWKIWFLTFFLHFSFPYETRIHIHLFPAISWFSNYVCWSMCNHSVETGHLDRCMSVKTKLEIGKV